MVSFTQSAGGGVTPPPPLLSLTVPFYIRTWSHKSDFLPILNCRSGCNHSFPHFSGQTSSRWGLSGGVWGSWCVIYYIFGYHTLAWLLFFQMSEHCLNAFPCHQRSQESDTRNRVRPSMILPLALAREMAGTEAFRAWEMCLCRWRCYWCPILEDWWTTLVAYSMPYVFLVF